MKYLAYDNWVSTNRAFLKLLRSSFIKLNDELWFRIFIFVILFFLASIALGVDFQHSPMDFKNKGALGLSNLLIQQIQNVNLSTSLAACFLSYIGIKVLFKSEFNWYALTLSIAYSILMVLGDTFSANYDLAYLVATHNQKILAILLVLGYTSIFYVLVKCAFLLLDSIPRKFYCYFSNLKASKFILIFLPFIFLLAWGAFIWVFLSGSMGSDMRGQILRVVGSVPFSIHHPFFSTLIYGGGV